MSTPAYLIDQTPLYGIKYDLIKASVYGDDAVLGFLKINNATGAFESIVAGGLKSNWQPRRVRGQKTRFFDVLLLAPVTVEICKQVVALQVNGIVFEKVDQTPFDGSTPQQWSFECDVQLGTAPITL
jgi:hypothetical protein